MKCLTVSGGHAKAGPGLFVDGPLPASVGDLASQSSSTLPASSVQPNPGEGAICATNAITATAIATRTSAQVGGLGLRKCLERDMKFDLAAEEKA